ncbi:MAG: hypothetical protein AB1650_07340 [Candidatus Omnitrophota bacterium]
MPDVVSLISWGAIFAGVVLILAFQFMFSVLDLALGLSRIKPAENGKEAGKVLKGTAIGWIIGSLVAVFLGTWVTGSLTGDISPFDAMLHGVVVWGLTVVIGAFIISSAAGTMLGGAMGLLMSSITSAARAARKAIHGAVPQIQESVQERGGIEQQWAKMRSQIEEILRETGKPELQPEHMKAQVQAEAQRTKAQGQQASQDPQQIRQELESALKRILEEGVKTTRGVDKEAIANVIEKQTHMSHEKAQSTADRWVSTYEQTIPKVQEKVEMAKEKAEEAAQKTSEVVSSAAKWSFVMLFLTLIIAALGSWVGTLT